MTIKTFIKLLTIILLTSYSSCNFCCNFRSKRSPC